MDRSYTITENKHVICLLHAHACMQLQACACMYNYKRHRETGKHHENIHTDRESMYVHAFCIQKKPINNT